MAPPLRRLETTGRPELTGLERSVQEQLDGVRADMQAYTPGVPGNWATRAPTTVAEALDRIAAALGPIP